MTEETNTTKLTVEPLLQQAIAQHQAGRLQEAEELYRTILQSRPNHPEANHNMGVLAVQMQRPAAGLPYFMAALDADPECAQYWLSGIDALFRADQLDAAREVMAVALQQGLQGDEVDALVARINAAAQISGQADAENQHVLESQSVSSTPLQCHTKDPSSQEIDRLVALFNEERYPEAIILAQTMTELFPLHGFGWKALGALFTQMGRTEDALAPMQKAAALSPDDAEVQSNLGLSFYELGRLDEAETSYRRALEIRPDFVEMHYNLGSTLQALDRLEEAVTSYRQVPRISSDFVETHYRLGAILHELGRLDEAKVSYQQVLQIMPNDAKAHNSLSNTFFDLGQLDASEASCRRALEIKPDFIDAYNNLGNTLQELGRADEAEACYRRALEIKPDYAVAHFNLGCVFQKQGRLVEAEQRYRRALEIQPYFVEAYYNLGITLNSLGRLDEAETNYRRALEIKPDHAEAHSSLIFTLDLMVDKESVSLEERRQWDVAHAAHLYRQQVHANIQEPERRIRIGYVSADFKNHSAPRAFGGMLTQYDRSQFDVFAYSNFKGNSDRFTELFKQSVTVWRNIGNLSDDAVAKMIREDRIDILVDLSGHSAGNRLPVFARKPAPIQITAWGYAAGTGMRAMDVFFTDSMMVPPEDKRYFTEEIRYLPSAMGAFFIDPFPDVNKLPALSNGFVTFGSLNRLAKVSDNAYRAWAEVLLAIPRSRLILKTPELNDAATRAQLAGHFTKIGVTADRIVMLGKTSWHEHMQAYHRIDIGLDPFPQGGGVTALESLMMGVPIINLLGATLAGKVSASIMTTLGLPDWIATSREQYVEFAVRKAADLQSLAVLRQQLRGIFTSSVIGDQIAYARVVELEYRKLWREWCSLV